MNQQVGQPESMLRVVDFEDDDVPAVRVRGVSADPAGFEFDMVDAGPAQKPIHSSRDADPTKLNNVSLANELAELALRGEKGVTPQQHSDMMSGAVAAVEFILDVDGLRTATPKDDFDIIPADALVTELARRLQSNGGNV